MWRKKNNVDSEEIELIKYEIGIMLLENIPFINKDFISIDIYDLTVTQLKRNYKEIEKIDRNNGKKIKRIIISPEIVLNLKNNNEKISLVDCLLPDKRVLASKAVVIDTECEKEKNADGKEIYKKLVFDLNIYTRKQLQKTIQTYEEYQNEIATIKKSHKEELEALRKTYDNRMESMLDPYRKNEDILRKKIQERDDKILELISTIPSQMNEKLLSFVKKLNKEEDDGKGGS